MFKSEYITTTHAFFSRNGGVSEGIYNSLNCALGSGDNPENVAINRSRAAERLGIAPENLVTLAQIHSNICIAIKDDSRPEDERGGKKIFLPHRQQADAMATNIKGVALGILTADCVPVLFHDSKNNVIGAAHAGWKGAISGVIENTVAAMLELGADKKHICAVIGPCIGQESYEVDASFREKFILDSADNRHWFADGKDHAHWQFDLRGYVLKRLEMMGLKNCSTIAENTYSQSGRFFSYRRATHRQEPDYGRQLSAIALA